MHRGSAMPMKDIFRRLRPLPLYSVLVLSLAYFLAQSVVSYATHALTLLVGSYHMLCNVLALLGVVFTLKNKESESVYGDRRKGFDAPVVFASDDVTSPVATDEKRIEAIASQRTKHERSLKNTFGWARVDVVVTTMVCVFLASLCFSLLVEAVQTLIHIDHQDPMHHPIPVLCVGGAGLVVNGLCYLLIGGYTFQQGSYLQVTPAGDVILDRAISGSEKRTRKADPETQKESESKETTKSADNQSGKIDKEVEAIVPKQEKIKDVFMPRRQGGREMARDIMSSIFVIICSLFVYWTDHDVAKYVDPVISIISCLCLLWLSYPYMKESSLILLQTIPASIDIDSLKANLLEAFPDIVNVHELHVWQLAANKIVSTAHIVFQNPEDYGRITNEIADFFTEQGITQATIQPEFNTSQKLESSSSMRPKIKDACLMRCPGTESCRVNNCCGTTEHDNHQEDNTDVKGPHKRGASSLVSIKIDDGPQKEIFMNVADLQQKYDVVQLSQSTENIAKKHVSHDEEKLISSQHSKSMIDVHSFRAEVKNILTDVKNSTVDVKTQKDDLNNDMTNVTSEIKDTTSVTTARDDTIDITTHATVDDIPIHTTDS